MDVVALILGIIVTGGVAVFVAWPWRQQRADARLETGPDAGLAEEAQIDRLARRREASLAALRDLDFDYATGKVAEADYGPLRQALVAEAAEILTQLDQVQAAAEADLDGFIEAELRAIRAGRAANGGGASAGGACPTCGWPVRSGALYCANCGAKLGDVPSGSAAVPERSIRPTTSLR